MKKYLSLFILTGILIGSCNMKSKNESDNPFYTDYNTPFQVPAFDKIKNQHYLPAIEEGIRQQEKEVENIVSNQDEPDFANTIEALEKTGRMLDNVTSVFYNQNSANTNEEIQEIAKQIAPLLSKLQDDILMNEELFNKVKIVNDRKDQLSLSPEQNKLLEETYKSFVRGGANLSDEDKNKLRKINEELSILSLRFGENVLAETNDYKLVIEDEENLAGLPESVVAGASEAAKEAGLEGKWVFTLHKPSMIPFLQFSKKRDLREKIFKAYYSRGDNNNNYDNKEVLSKMANLRLERAKLLGYESHAAFILSDNMAKEPKNVYQLLDRLWDAALPNAKAEAAELQKLIDKEGGDFKLASWDWWYYAEKLKKEKYDLDEESLRPYFQLNNVIDGVFYVVNKLYGLTFVPRTDIPTYQEDVKVFEVQEANGSHIGILYMDFFPRSSKRAGAWMSSYRKQRFDGETKITPVITNVFNFSKPTEGKPALLSLEEVTTTFHEFGHALHGLLSNCKYNSLSGTSVARDFVELPSQIMENWATEPEVMKVYAKHYKTDEPIPDELIEKISNARFFNQGFELTEYLAASFLDMNYHTLTEPKELDVEEFETDALNQIGLIPEIIVRYRSTYFQHIFSGGYSSGYYSYIWAEVLDADAFHAFKETSLFDQSYALAFRKNILEKGGTDDPMKLYVQFRGAEPNIDPLLKRRGINL